MDQNTLTILVLVAIVAIFGVTRLQKTKNRGGISDAIREGAIIIDVRSPGEFATGHYDGAINIPVDTLEKKLSKVGPKDKPIVVYCASGGRSATAAAILGGAGFTKVFNGGGLSNMPSR